MTKPLKVTFILPFVNLTGGIKILLEHANRLAKRGYQISIIYPGVLFHGDKFATENITWQWRLVEAPLRQLKYWFFTSLLGKTEADWFTLDRRVRLKRTPDLSARYIPTANIVIGTAPETIPWVASYPTEKGIKVHFAQDYEVWYLPEDFVRGTFDHREMRLITIGGWQKKLYESFGRKVEAVIPDGVDLDRFNPGDRTYSDNSRPTRVLMNYHEAPYKGIADGQTAIKLVRQAGHKIDLVMFGMHPLPAELGVEYHQAIAEADLPTLYRSCDIFLWPTHREGFGLPPMEALACGTPVVATATGAVADYLKESIDGFIIPIKQPKQLAAKLLRLVIEPAKRAQMGKAGAKAMLNWDWDNQTDKLEKYLLSIQK